MVERYSRPKMSHIWDVDNRFAKMLEVEIAVASVQARMGIIPRKAAVDIERKARFSVKRIGEIEAQTKHDVIAFVSAVAESVGPAGKYLHFGLTSSDVLDTAMSLQVREAYSELQVGLKNLEQTLKNIVRQNVSTLCAGRTHGMWAEPTSFGVKMAGHLCELRRNRRRLDRAIGQLMICKLSGAVGTYSSLDSVVEERLARKLNLQIETVATQVVPRDRHAEVLWALTSLTTGYERLAIELRHLQRSEVGEVLEGFSPGQKGSSAMPHKKNPISAENITGLARLMRGFLIPAIENVALWHERDISHSSVERVIFPDAFILADYATYRMNQLLSQLVINKKAMIKNIEASRGTLFSSQVLLALVDKGWSREDAYRVVQRLSHTLGEREHLRDKVAKDSEIKGVLSVKEIRSLFLGEKLVKRFKLICDRAIKEENP